MRPGADHAAMTRPIRSSKVFLLADRRELGDETGTIAVRRYRLARLRLEARPAEPQLRFEHLKRVYD